MSSLQRLPDPLDKASQTEQDSACKSNTIWGGGPITMLMKPGHQPSARLPPPILLIFGAWHSRLTSGEMRRAAWRGNMYLLP